MQDGPAYVRVFVSILRNISKEETIEYVLGLIDEMLTGRKAFGNQIRLKLTFDTLPWFWQQIQSGLDYFTTNHFQMKITMNLS